MRACRGLFTDFVLPMKSPLKLDDGMKDSHSGKRRRCGVTIARAAMGRRLADDSVGTSGRRGE